VNLTWLSADGDRSLQQLLMKAGVWLSGKLARALVVKSQAVQSGDDGFWIGARGALAGVESRVSAKNSERRGHDTYDTGADATLR
jgi:hypothetical protein